MGNLFGVRRRAPLVTPQDRAVLQLKQQRDKIKIYQKRTEAEMANGTRLALSLFKNGMKDRALIVLRRKKMMEDILTRTEKQLATLESLVTDIEYTQVEVSVVEGLKVGTEALKQLTSLMNIDDIQRMMEDNAEAAEKQNEISAILSQTTERYDEDDLLAELEQYKKESAKTQPATATFELEASEAAVSPKFSPTKAKVSVDEPVEVSADEPACKNQKETEAIVKAADLENLPEVPANPPDVTEEQVEEQGSKKRKEPVQVSEETDSKFILAECT